MKHLLLFSLVALLSSGCKRDVAPNDDRLDEQGGILINASNTASIERTGKASNKVPDNFDGLSSIGLFTQLKSKDGTEDLLTGNPANARFDYGQTVWFTHTAADRLRYADADPIILFGYFPHSNIAGSILQQGAKPHLFDFALATDQSTEESVRLSNLMWCRADNGGNGFVRQDTPINMLFGHLLCKLSISIRVIDSKALPGDLSSKMLIRKITVGANPNAGTAGQIGVKASLNVLGSDASLQTTEVGSVVWNDGGTPIEIPVTAKDAPATFVTDLLLLPFEAQGDENRLLFTMDFSGADAGKGLEFIAKIPEYTGSTVPPAVADGNKWRFGRNDHVEMTVTVDVSTSIVKLSAKIAPWLSGGENGLDADPA